MLFCHPVEIVVDKFFRTSGIRLFAVIWDIKTRWEVVVRVVDIGEIIHHHCLTFLVIFMYQVSIFSIVALGMQVTT